MAKIKQIGMAAGTFSVALGIGFVMQNGDALASRFGAESAPQTTAPFAAETPAEATVVQAAFEAEPAMPADVAPIETVQAGVAFATEPDMAMPEADVADAIVLPEAAVVPDVPEAPVQMASIDPEILPDFEPEAAVESVANCVPTMMAVPGDAATVNLAISAPCHVATPFTIHHQGMMFSAMTDDAGRTKVTVPALAEVAVVIAAFENGDGAVATTTVPDFASYDRAVLQWQGDAAVMLSAYEGDAEFGTPNHIHAANPGDLARVAAAEGGYLLRLGDPAVDEALMAEVYTYPSGMMGTAADVFLVAEAEITAGNCGKEMSAQSIQVSPSGATTALDLTMVMPECDAVGDFLILQNMFESLTLASR